MAKPLIHAESSAKKYGGNYKDYIDIHAFMDSSKQVLADNRHRFLTHNAWFSRIIIPLVYGETFARKSDGKIVSSRDISEQHCVEDFRMKFLPTVNDYLTLCSNEMLSKWIPIVQNKINSQLDSNNNYHNQIKKYIDLPRAIVDDERHVLLTYNSFYLHYILPQIQSIDYNLLNEIKKIKAINAYDFLIEMSYDDWLQNGKGNPPSFAEIKIYRERNKDIKEYD